MDFLLEFAFELVGEIIMESGEYAASDHRLPRWARILILTVLALFCALVFGIILLVGIAALRDWDTVWISLLLFALDAVFVFVTVRKARKILRTFSKK